MSLCKTDQRAIAQNLFDNIAQATQDEHGITRESFGPGEERGLCLLEAAATSFGLQARRDAYQNLWLSREGDPVPDDSSAPSIVIGSHLDSVPQGGNFDGLAGVVAGILVLLQAPCNDQSGPALRVLALRGEESAWYGKAYMGSLALTGQLRPQDLARMHRNQNQTMAQAMQACGVNMDLLNAGRPLVSKKNIAAYLELHIEQGPVMVARHWPVALVTGIRGNLRHNRIRCTGETGHSGAVPRWLRKDALMAVSELLHRLDEQWRVLLQMGMDLVMTAGMCSTPVATHAVSVIPGDVQFSFEVRSQDEATLKRFHTLMQQECQAIEAARGVRFEFDDAIYTAPARMDASWTEQLQKTAVREGLHHGVMASGAGHDAAVFANVGIPAAMVFIRNEHGSHNPKEAMDLDDFLLGVQWMQQAIRDGSNNA